MAASSSHKLIQEIYYTLSEERPYWRLHSTFTGADLTSGVACTISNDVGHLYFVDSDSHNLVQQLYNFSRPSIWRISKLQSNDFHSY